MDRMKVKETKRLVEFLERNPESEFGERRLLATRKTGYQEFFCKSRLWGDT